MGPIQLGFLGIGLTIFMVALARGYKKELGVAIICMTAIFLLTYTESRVSDIVATVGEGLFNITDETQLDWFIGTTYTIIFVAIVFSSYAGNTLEFAGKPLDAPGGTLISAGIGVLNGYLIAGTLWYYQNTYGYPMQRIFDIDTTLNAVGQVLVEYLPPVLFPSPVYWIIPVAILLILRVRG